MQKSVFLLVLSAFVSSVFLFSFLPATAAAESKVYHKKPQHQVELYVTSW